MGIGMISVDAERSVCTTLRLVFRWRSRFCGGLGGDYRDDSCNHHLVSNRHPSASVHRRREGSCDLPLRSQISLVLQVRQVSHTSGNKSERPLEDDGVASVGRYVSRRVSHASMKSTVMMNLVILFILILSVVSVSQLIHSTLLNLQRG